MLASLPALPLTLRSRHRRGILFSLSVSVLNYAVMFPFEGGGGGAHHVVMLHPFPVVFAVASLAAVAERWKRWRLFTLAIGAALLVNLSLNARYLAGFLSTGGAGNFSDAIYDMTDLAASEPAYRYHLLDWGMSTQFAFLTDSEVDWDEHFGIYANSQPRKDQQKQIDVILADPTSRLMIHSKDKKRWISACVTVNGLPSSSCF